MNQARLEEEEKERKRYMKEREARRLMENRQPNKAKTYLEELKWGLPRHSSGPTNKAGGVDDDKEGPDLITQIADDENQVT